MDTTIVRVYHQFPSSADGDRFYLEVFAAQIRSHPTTGADLRYVANAVQHPNGQSLADFYFGEHRLRPTRPGDFLQLDDHFWKVTPHGAPQPTTEVPALLAAPYERRQLLHAVCTSCHNSIRFQECPSGGWWDHHDLDADHYCGSNPTTDLSVAERIDDFGYWSVAPYVASEATV